MQNEILAYLAGAVDSDGSIGIRKSTYATRHNTAWNPTYAARISLHQVTPQIPELLKETFDGSITKTKPSTENGKPLLAWNLEHKKAVVAAQSLLPFLRVKRRQAQIILELQLTRGEHYKRLAYWYKQENPEWENSELITFIEAAHVLNTDPSIIRQAVSNGSIPSITLERPQFARNEPRIPKNFLTLYKQHQYRSIDNRGRGRPLQLIQWREKLWLECRELNRIGTGKHPISELTGIYTPLPAKRLRRVIL